MKRKVRRTIRRFFLDGQTYYRGHHIVTGMQLAAFFGQATIQRVWNPARETRRIESNAAGIGRRSQEPSMSFEMERLIGAPHLLFQPRIR